MPTMRAFMNPKSANSNNDNNKGSSSVPTTTVFSNDSNLLQSIYFSHMQQNLLLLEEDETPMSAYTHQPLSGSSNNNYNNNNYTNNTDPSPMDGSNNFNQQQQQYNFVDLDGFGSIGPLSQFDIPLSINITGYQLTHKEEKKQRERELKREAARLKKQMENKKTAVLRDEADEMEKRMKYDGLSFFRNGFMIFTNSSETELDEGSDRGRPSFASQDGACLFDEGTGITSDIMYGEYQQQEDEAAHDEVDLLEQQLIYFYPNTVEKRSQLNIVGFIQSFLIFSDSFAPLIPDTCCAESIHDFDLITSGSPSPNSSSSNYDHTESLLSASLKAEANHSNSNNVYMNSKECNHPVNLIQFNHSKMAIVRYYNVIYCLCAPISTPNSILHENLIHILNSFAFIYGSYNIKEILSKKSCINERQIDIDKVSTDFYVSSSDCKYESTIDVFEDIAEGPFPARSMFHDNNLKIPWIASPYSPIVSNSYKRKKSANRWNAEQQRVLDDFCLLIKMYTVSQALQSSVDESLPIKAMTQRIFPFAIPYTEIPEKNIFIKAMGILNQLQDAYGSNRLHISPSYHFTSIGTSLSGMVQKQLETINHGDYLDQENLLNRTRKGSLIGSALFFMNESVMAVNNLDERVLQYILFRLRCIEKNFCEYKDFFDESFNAEIVSSPTTKAFAPSPYTANASRQDSSNVTPIPLRQFKNTPSTPVTNTQSPMAKPVRINSLSNSLTPGGNATPRGTPTGVSPLARSITKAGNNSSNNLLRATTTPEARQRMMTADNSPGGMSTLSAQSSTTSVITSPTTNNSNETSVFGVNAYKTSDDWFMFETTSVQDLQGSKDDDHQITDEREKISRINLDYNMFIISGKKDSEFILLSEEDQIDYTVVYMNREEKLSTIMEKHVLVTYRFRDLSLCTIWKFEDTFNWRCELNDCIIKIRTEMRPILRQISRKMDRSNYTNLLLMREESAPYKLHGNVRCKRPVIATTMNNASGNSNNNTEQDSVFCLIYDQFNNMVTTTNTSSKTFFVNVAKARNTFLTSENQQVEWWNETSKRHSQHFHKPSKQVSKLFLKNDRDGYIYSKQLFGSQVYYYKQQQQQDTTTQNPPKTAAYFSLSKLEQSVRESIRNEFKINLL